jgi:hypothetical protein
METTAPQVPSEIPCEWAILSFFGSFDSKVNHLDVTWEYLQDTPLPFHGEVSLKDWEGLRPFIAEEIAAQNRERLKQRLKPAVREKVIRDWLARYAADLTANEKHLVTSGIEGYLEQDSPAELEGYLEALLKQGVATAEKKRKKSGRVRDYLRNAWAVLVGTVKFAIAFAVLSVASSRFETIVLAMLVMIYVTAEAAHLDELCTSVAIAMGTHSEFGCIHQALNSYVHTQERQAIIQEQRAAKKVLHRGTVRIYVARIVSAAIWLLAVWKLISAIVA